MDEDYIEMVLGDNGKDDTKMEGREHELFQVFEIWDVVTGNEFSFKSCQN